MIIVILVFVSCNEKTPIVEEDEPVIEEEENLPDKCCSCLEEQGISDKYIYPYTTGDLIQFDDYRVKLEVCQIPEDTLKNMCTHGLVDTYYDFPLLFTEMFSEASVKMGLKRMEGTFNGFLELISRNDIPEKLIKRYKEVDPSSLDSVTDAIEIGVLRFHINFQEITMGYDSICEKFTSEQRRTVIEYGLKVLNGKREYKHDDFSIKCTYYLLGNMLLKEEYQPFVDYLDENNAKALINGFLFYASSLLIIEEFAETYLKETADK